MSRQRKAQGRGRGWIDTDELLRRGEELLDQAPPWLRRGGRVLDTAARATNPLYARVRTAQDLVTRVPKPAQRPPVTDRTSASTVQRANTRSVQPARMKRPTLAELNRHPFAIKAAGYLGGQMGRGLGYLDTGIDLAEGVIFLGRLANPSADYLLSPKGQSAPEQLWRGGKQVGADVGGYVGDRWRHPEKIGNDIARALQDANVALNPRATPEASTASEEMQRRIAIGRNQGRLEGEVVSNFVPFGLPAKVGRFGGVLSKEALIARYIDEGVPPGMAAYWAEPYVGMGSHYLSRKTARDLGLPRFLTDSMFNVQRPTRITRGDMYRLHYEVDPHYHGGKNPARAGGGSWSGKQLGWKKLGPIERFWYGAPTPTKSGGLQVVDGVGHVDPLNDEGGM